MCPPISCCHRRLTAALPTQVYYLVRLLLAHGTAEVLPDQVPLLEDRLAALWGAIQHAVQHRYRLSDPEAIALTETLAAQLLRAECCRRSLRRTVPLAEALGPMLALS